VKFLVVSFLTLGKPRPVAEERDKGEAPDLLMAFANLRSVRLRYELAGREDAPVVVFSNSLGADLSMWNAQMAEFSRGYRVLRYDTRGHGESSLPAGPHNLAALAGDVLDLLDYLTIPAVSFCGLSLGGMTGLWLAQNSPKRIRKVIACSSAAKIGTLESWDSRIGLVRREGMAAVVPGILERWFTPAFHAKSPEAIRAMERLLLNIDVDGYAAGCAAVRDADFREGLSAVMVPILLANGASDPVAPPLDGQALAALIPRARYLEFPGSHLFPMESAAELTAAVLGFLDTP
jgi:3-oxoadipate enol-lactonase